ncbi:hypothetical protein DSCA_34280 [Desulfosarcina alkanivorans]|uniref:Uncharacterized protein n=1 Tax=Desulfosarcina alkanivorans TaxID=571177 RepID=A0A5K7YKZ9_9BACT|nr:hypothetical protein DSCA_34280 [Desulfosarcina alkanivorans]
MPDGNKGLSWTAGGSFRFRNLIAFGGGVAYDLHLLEKYPARTPDKDGGSSPGGDPVMRRTRPDPEPDGTRYERR